MLKNKKYHLFRSVFWWLNILFGILLLISESAGTIAPHSAPIIALTGLIYPVLLISQFLFFIGWIVARNLRFLLPFMLIIIGYPNIKNNVGFHCFAAKQEKSDFRLFTYNVKGFSNRSFKMNEKSLKSTVLQFAIGNKPDIICMQEYRASKRKPEIIRKNFKSGSYYFRDYYGNKQVKNIGLLIISVYPSVGNGFLRFRSGRTFAIYSDLVIKKDTFRIINVHLASISLNSNDLYLLSSPFEKTADNLEWLQWRKIYRKLTTAFRLHEQQMDTVKQTIQNSEFPVILCGDFNDTPSSYAYHQAAALLHDSYTDKACLMKSTYAGPLPFLRIDYVFLPPQLQATGYKRYDVQLSDHYAVGVGLNFKKDQ